MNTKGKNTLRNILRKVFCSAAISVFTAAVSFLAYAQTDVMHTVSGTVTDDLGNPLAGASILVKGQPISGATITDIDGNFSIQAPDNSILLVSYIGFKDMKIPVRNKEKVNIIMTENTELLKDVVVVGY